MNTGHPHNADIETIAVDVISALRWISTTRHDRTTWVSQCTRLRISGPDGHITVRRETADAIFRYTTFAKPPTSGHLLLLTEQGKALLNRSTVERSETADVPKPPTMNLLDALAWINSTHHTKAAWSATGRTLDLSGPTGSITITAATAAALSSLVELSKPTQPEPRRLFQLTSKGMAMLGILAA